MQEYAYYPGCSLECTASPYDKSIRAVFAALGVGLHEIEDWNCCGATMYMSVKKIVGYAISARNLALAQNMGMQICAPCSSCYTILRKTNRHIAWNLKERAKINEALKAAHLSYDTVLEVRHPLDILVHDIGIEKIKARAVKTLNGIKVAPYYGCQIIRPHGYFDDRDDPMTMDHLLSALGAKVVDYPLKVRCCGGMLMTTQEEIALKLNCMLLQAAVDNGADMIATACPLCEMNLEAYQDKIGKKYGRSFHIPIVYFSHLVGAALGAAPKTMELDKLMIPAAQLDNLEPMNRPLKEVRP